MHKDTLKIVGSALSAVALVSGGATMAVAAPADAPDAGSTPTAVTAREAAGSTVVEAVPVEGTFSFDQGSLTATESIAGVFAKAAAVLCTAMPAYETQAASAIDESAPGGASFTATVDEMASEEGAESYIMACSCASNVPGGGAIANAEVEGVSLATILKMAAA